MENIFNFQFNDCKMNSIINNINIHRDNINIIRVYIYELIQYISEFIFNENEIDSFEDYTTDERFELLKSDNNISKDLYDMIIKLETIINENNDENELNLRKILLSTFELLIQIKSDYTNEISDIEAIKYKFEMQLEKEFGFSNSKNNINEKSGMLNGSYLLYLLDKLSISSREAIQGGRGFDKFDEYMNVDRAIKYDLIDIVNEVNKSEISQLIFLGGSTGDGKSHLLSSLKKYNEKNITNIEFYNDATESDKYYETAVETLEKKLRAFSDEFIDSSNKKMLLAINLGVLNNFISLPRVRSKYSRLVKFIEDSRILEEESISHTFKDNNFSVINFQSYNVVELNRDNVSSHYLDALFSKVGSPNEDNIFYQAYVKDLNNGLEHDFIINYEIFTDEIIRKQIVKNICEVIIKYRTTFSTRHILDFIYKVIVPPNILEEKESKNVIDLTHNLLPNLLFDYPERSPILSYLHRNDISSIRNKILDDLLVDMNFTNDIKKYANTVLPNSNFKRWTNKLEDLLGFSELDKDIKSEVERTIIRLQILSQAIVIEDEIFKEFYKILYGYMNEDFEKISLLYDNIESAIYKWYGWEDNNIVDIKKDKVNFRIGCKLELEQVGEFSETPKDNISYLPYIKVAFKEKSSDKIVKLNIDYFLYNTIKLVLDGYNLNKNDLENSIALIEFIETLINYAKINNSLIIKDSFNREFVLEKQLKFKREVYKFGRK